MKKIFSISLLFFSLLFFSQKKWDLKFYNELAGNEYIIYADNSEVMPMSVKFSFKMINLKSSIANDEIIVIPADTKGFW